MIGEEHVDMGQRHVPVLVVTGPVGIGKSSVGAAVAELLTEAGVAHGMVDLDYLRWCYPAPASDRFNTALGLRNLAAVWQNYQSAGAMRLVLADVVESREDLERYRRAVPGAEIMVVRLEAPLEVIVRRLEGREEGASLEWSRLRAAQLVEQMACTRVEDLLVDTAGKAVLEVAREVLHWWMVTWGVT